MYQDVLIVDSNVLAGLSMELIASDETRFKTLIVELTQTLTLRSYRVVNSLGAELVFSPSLPPTFLSRTLSIRRLPVKP
jgi:hypothetical protein